MSASKIREGKLEDDPWLRGVYAFKAWGFYVETHIDCFDRKTLVVRKNGA